MEAPTSARAGGVPGVAPGGPPRGAGPEQRGRRDLEGVARVRTAADAS